MSEYVRDSFVDIPMPAILSGVDHHRAARTAVDGAMSPDEIRDVLARVESALQTCTDYGRALWEELTAVATYLREDVARAAGGTGIVHTEEQWQRWQDIYAGVLSSLAGPAGDSGYGAWQAGLERTHRHE